MAYCLRDLRENIEYRLELYCEGCMDCVDRMRKPLMILAALSVLMTIRVAKQGISNAQSMGYAGISDKFCIMGLCSRSGPSPYGQDPYNTMGGPMAMSTYSSSANKQALSDLLDAHTGKVKVLKAGVFKDYGGKTVFEGEIVTLKSVEATFPVEVALQEPGNGRVLVVDGAGSLRASIFDAALAKLAQQNGWAGVILFGCVRNSKDLASVSIGIKAIGTNPVKGTGKASQKGKRIKFGGIMFVNKHYLYADEDGIAVTGKKQDYVPPMPASSFGSGGYGGVGGAVPQSYSGVSSYAAPGGSGGSSYGTSGTSTYGGSGGSSYGTSGTSTYGGSGTSTYGGSGTSTYGGSGTSAYGGSGTSTYGGSGTSTYGGSGTSTYGGSGTSTYGGSGTSTYGGSGGSSYGASGGSNYGTVGGSSGTYSGGSYGGGSSYSNTGSTGVGGGSYGSGGYGAATTGYSGVSGGSSGGGYRPPYRKLRRKSSIERTRNASDVVEVDKRIQQMLRSSSSRTELNERDVSILRKSNRENIAPFDV